MTLIDDIKLLTSELDNFYLDVLLEEGEFGERQLGLPDFVTASTGFQVNFTNKSRKIIFSIATAIHNNDDILRKSIEINEFEKIVRQCVADYYSEGRLSDFSETTEYDVKTALVEYIKSKAERHIQEFTHYFPAWTLGMESVSPFSIGPVTFLTRDQWIDSVDIPDALKDTYLEAREANYRWRDILREALSSRASDVKLEGFAGNLYEPIKQCPSVLKISLSGREKSLSRKLAEIICRSALDSVSLIFGSQEFFHQQTLAIERLAPIRTDSLIQVGKYLCIPGISLGHRVPFISPAKVSSELEKVPDLLRAIGYTLDALVDGSLHRHPNLASRWTMALNWYAEGSREKDDAIALAKIASSLDVLSQAGTRKGITDLLSNLLCVDSDYQVISGKSPKTLKQYVAKMYDEGRSKILHGSHENRLEAYAEARSQAAYFSRMALLESVLRLENYTGSDSGTAFRLMKRNNLS